MREIKVKICGLTNKPDVDMCLRSGVDILGFVVEYPLEVPWNLNRADASRLLTGIKAASRQTCIVTGGSPAKVIKLAAYLRPSLVQLHFREKMADAIYIADALQDLNIGVIKSISPVKEDLFCQFGTDNLEEVVIGLNQSSISGLLVDSRVPTNAAEKGSCIDTTLCKEVISYSRKPVTIAGGINADNVGSYIAATGARCIDVMTGVESSAGCKEEKLLHKLLGAIAKGTC